MGGRKEGKGGHQICFNQGVLHFDLTPLLALISYPYQKAVGGKKKGYKVQDGLCAECESDHMNMKCSDCCVQMKAKS